MKKWTSGITLIAFFVVLSATGILFLTTIETAEAGPTRFVVEWWWYKCSEIETGVVCTPWFIRIKVKPKESLWHKLFGSHPHGHDFIYKKKDDRHQKVISCSQCDF